METSVRRFFQLEYHPGSPLGTSRDDRGGRRGIRAEVDLWVISRIILRSKTDKDGVPDYFCYCEVGFSERVLGDHIITMVS